MGLSEQFSRNVEITPSYTLTLGDSPSAAVSAAAKGSLRYNHAATRFEASVDGGAWAALSGTFGGSIAANQVAFGSGANTIAGNASLTWDNTLKKFAVDSSLTIASAGGLAWDAFALSGTITLTGTTTVTALSLARLAAPTITAGSAVTVTDAATLTISGAPVAGGSAVLTNKWALRIVSGAIFVPLNATAAIPAIAIGGPSIGLNAISPNRLAFITAGTQGPEINASNQYAALNGIVSIPGFAFRDDPDSGLYSVSGNVVGGTTGSVLRFDFGPGGFAIRSGTNSLGSGDGLYFEYGGTVANTAKIIAITPGIAYRALQVDAVSIALRVGTDNGLVVDSSRNVVLHSAALATNATDGFLYVTTVPGTPTGAATSYTGRSPLVVDSTNSLLYFRNGGAWVAAGTGTVTGTGVANRVAYWSGTSALTSDADFTFDGTTLGLDGPMNFLDSANPSAPSDGVSIWSKTDNLVSRDPDDCYHSIAPIPPSAGSATVHWEKWFRVTSAGTSTTFDISLTTLNGVNCQVNNGVFWIEVIWLNMQSTTYVFTRQRRACYRWDDTTSTIEEMAESALETLQLGAAGGDMTFAVSGTSDVRVTLSTSVSDQIDGRCFARVLFADPS